MSELQIAIGTVPDLSQPNPFPLERDKFANDNAWFKQYARWITFNFYNYNIRNVFQDSAYDFNFCNGILENFSYYYGEQANKIFAYAAQLPSGENVPVPFIAGQQIRNYVDNMVGTYSQIVRPMGDSISCVNLDYESILDKQVRMSVAKMTVKAKPMLDQLKQQGVNFQPTEKEYATEDEVDIDEEDKVDEYEEAGIKITRSIYYEEELENQFISQDAIHQFVGGISGTIIERKGDKVSHTHVPSYNCIYDYRAKDNWGKDALIGGAIILMTPEEIALECPGLTPEELERISYMAKSGNQDAVAFRANMNNGYNNLKWWGNDGRIAVARVYWITKRDLLNHRSVNSLGQKTVKIYDKNKMYQTDEKNDRGGYVHKAGDEIRGEDYTWDVATCMLIGNNWATKVGYVDNVVRNKEGFPQLPFQFYSYNLINGYSKSIVSRLKPLEAEYDRIMMKIREKMGRDYGRVFIFNGKKMGIDDTIQILTDWKTSGTYVSAGEQNYLSNDGERLVEMIDGTLENINPYLQMLQVLRTEMQQTVSISDYALGMQTETVGKAVQQQSVANSTIANLGIFEGMKTFARKKLQYSFELAKQFIKEGHYSVVVDKDEVQILNVTKDTLSKDLGIFFVENDAINEDNKKFLRDYLFNLSQNAQVMQAMGIEPVQVLDLIESYTYKSGKKDFKRAIELNKKKYQEMQQAQAQSEQQAQAQQMQQQQAMIQQQQQEALNYEALMLKYKEEMDGWRNTQNNETKLLLQQNTQIMEALKIISDNVPVNGVLQAQQAAQQEQSQIPAQ